MIILAEGANVIQRINYKKVFDIVELLNRIKDKYKDFYITRKGERIYLKDNPEEIKKVLKYQECYGLYEDTLQGLLIIYREKNRKPIIKILAKDYKLTKKIIRYILYNFKDLKLFARLNKNNNLVQLLKKNKFVFKGYRGYKNSEVILCKSKYTKREKVNGKHQRESKRHN